MQSKKVLRAAAVFALTVTVATATMAGSTVQTTAAKTGHVRSSASPALVLGPQGSSGRDDKSQVWPVHLPDCRIEPRRDLLRPVFRYGRPTISSH